MNASQFKKAAKLDGMIVYRVRKYSNKYGSGYTVTYASQMSENTVSTESTKDFHEMELQEILDNQFSQI